MINPSTDRLDYGKILSKPEGYELDFAIGTTYSLDFDALLGVLVSLGLSVDTDSSQIKEPIHRLKTLIENSDKVALFCEGGQIHFPNKITPLYILLEKIVYQISLKNTDNQRVNPSFHPKFWLIRYINEEKEPIYRVIVMSRNLTFDRSWDISFCMDGEISDSKSEKNKPISDFITYLFNNVPKNNLTNKKLDKVKLIKKELSYVKFNLNDKRFKDFEFLPTGFSLNDKNYSTNNIFYKPLLKESCHDMLIISPFLSSSVIKNFSELSNKIDDKNYMLFTRKVSLMKLKNEDCKGFKIFTMKDIVIDGESAISEDNKNYKKQDIHTKLYMIRKYSDSYLYLGSLNASHNAIYRNVEFMILLKSSNRYLKLKDLAEDLFRGEEGNPLSPFEKAEIIEDPNKEETSNESDLINQEIRKFIHTEPEAEISQENDSYSLEIKTKKNFKSKYEISISPLLFNSPKEISNYLVFKNLNINQLSKFYKISIKGLKEKINRVIIIPTKNLPENRENSVISSIVDSEDKFFYYMNSTLDKNHIPTRDTITNLDKNNLKQTSLKNITYQDPIYEKMLDAATSSPEKFKEIDMVINAILSENKDGVRKQIISNEFIDLYNEFKEVLKINEQN